MRGKGILVRLYGLIAIGAVGLLALSAVGAFFLRNSLIQERVGLTRSMSQAARDIAKSFDLRVKNGELDLAAAQGLARATIRAMHYGKGDYLFAYTYDGVSLVNGNDISREGKNLMDFKDPTGRPYIAEMISLARANGSEPVNYIWKKPGMPDTDYFPKVSFASAYEPWGWVVGTGVYVDDIDRRFHVLALELFGAALTVIALTGLVASLVGKNVAGSINLLRDKMGLMSDGHLDLVIDEVARQDEIGEMAVSLEGFRQNMKRVSQLEADRANFTAIARQQQREAMLQMADRFEESSGVMVDNVHGAATDLQKTASLMGELMAETTQRTAAVDTASNRAASNVSTVAAATEELASSIGEISNLVNKSTSSARDAVAKANRSNDLIKNLADAALKINDVVQLIADIASQTNLLALNATIEAARAGEAGKGFAVVANEVKHLATATARATGEITERIKTLQDESGVAATAIQEIVATIGLIDEVASAVAAAVEQQSAATQDISKNIQIAAGSTAEVSDHVMNLMKIADTTGQSTKVLVVSAHIMAGLAEDLDEKVKDFGRFVRQR